MCSNHLMFRMNLWPSLIAKEIGEELEAPYEPGVWNWFLQPGVRAFVANGTAYGYDERFCVPGRHSRFVYLKDEMRSVLCRTWKLGDVPPSIPDNAVFITREQHEQVKDRSVPCRFKGCFDRYHCHWYDMDCEKDGAWNEIPPDWVVGDEKCESFTPKFL